MLIQLAIPADEYLRMYRGEVKYVWARAFDGRSIKFPAHYLRRFVTHDGVYGYFRLEFNEQRQLTNVVKVSN